MQAMKSQAIKVDPQDGQRTDLSWVFRTQMAETEN